MYTGVSPCSFCFVDPITRVNVDDKSYKNQKQKYHKKINGLMIYGALTTNANCEPSQIRLEIHNLGREWLIMSTIT